jgi:hypothetical protein
MTTNTNRTYVRDSPEKSPVLLGRALAVMSVAAIAIQWVGVLVAVIWLATRYDRMAHWFLVHWEAISFGRQEQFQSASTNFVPTILAMLVSLAVVFGIYIVSRPLERAIIRETCCFLVRNGSEFFMSIGVCHLLAVSGSSGSALSPDHRGLSALYKTYALLSGPRREALVEIVRRIEDTPSRIATDALMFLQVVRERSTRGPRRDDDADFLMNLLRDSKGRL